VNLEASRVEGRRHQVDLSNENAVKLATQAAWSFPFPTAMAIARAIKYVDERLTAPGTPDREGQARPARH
jgi:hypothetical protein